MSTTFETLGLPLAVTAVLSKQGKTEPFLIQEAAIPHGLDGRDILGQAPTGSGKTLAFGLPLLVRVGRGRPNQPKALILAPTRELAAQIGGDLRPFASALDIRFTVIHGGVSYHPQIKALRSGVDLLIATPGRLEDLVQQGSADLGQVEIVVLDEADRMADMGFLPAVRRIVAQTKRRRQTHLFSATLDGDVAALSREVQSDPVDVSVVSSPGVGRDADHYFWRVRHADRLEHATRVVAASGRTLVFTRTRHGADRLAKQLGRSDIGGVAAIHGGRSQSLRSRALRAFANGEVSALVATDVAARGIHVEDVDVVLHYDLPGDHKDYVHRSGRTARAGATGTVISLVAEGQERDIRRIQRAIDLSAPIEAPNMKWASAKVARPGQDESRPSTPTDVTHPKIKGSADGENLRIYVGNLPWSITDTGLQTLFAVHGKVKSAVISTQRKSGRSKGYGFVDMPLEDARTAIDVVNGSTLLGRTIHARAAW